MDAEELHGELFEGSGAADLGVMPDGEGGLRLTCVWPNHAGGERVHLPAQTAREAWHHMGELLGFPGAFDAEEMAVLNALVTFAAENVPGGLAEDERAIARKVGSATLRMAGPPDARRAFAEHYDVEPDELPPRLIDSRLVTDPDELRRLNEGTGFEMPGESS